MIIWVVTYQYYSDSAPVAVFSKKEDAEAYRQFQNYPLDYYVSEFLLDAELQDV